MLTQARVHWTDARLALRELAGRGRGLVATSELPVGTLLVVWGGAVVDGEALGRLTEAQRTHALQLDDDHYQLPAEPLEPADFVNHSCDPSAGIRGQVSLVSRRALAPGDEVTFDYATTDSSSYDEFSCACDTPRCRGAVRADDWRRADVRAQHAGWFSAYLAARIAAEETAR